MQAVLYISHGSRSQEGVQEAIKFIDQCRKKVNLKIQEICFLELVSPSIAEGISRCVKRGATHIAVVPILLLTAVHAKKDIPVALEKAKKIYPQIEFSYGSPLGVHPRLLECLYDQIEQEREEGLRDSTILLVGRGSSDPAVKSDLTEIASQFEQMYDLPNVHTCFLYGASPKFDDALLKLIEGEKKRIFILPYLFFSGLLMNGIKQKIAEAHDDSKQLILCKTLGHHPVVPTILSERIYELLQYKEKQWVM
ncbi:sirohydrochlorin chelatase [Lederbergia galactosidilytica]|uniref:Sirohydrochlorin ferrochelatase n=1 Tax=Lederbergia galactosidilytica TaxID=217031 RepID=A0A177ZY17_9BACI|nr:sirohydrochlorin chelatase [Lederbergia galactosidilytica]KRG09466.1 sirohydrochlorin ferrochelatase [Virgibacillus soli]OAK72200.1 sirohydrochlorin ferrochelatase [Lederbergia galactosidilytica]